MTTPNRLATVLDHVFQYEAPVRVSPRLLNLAVDSTASFYKAVNEVFAADWLALTGETVKFRQSHGKSEELIEAVKNGLAADTVTFTHEPDVNEIRDWLRLVPGKWRDQFPFKSSPFLSTIVFLVRKHKPALITNWDDLAKPGISVLTAGSNATSEARINYLAIWGYASRKFDGNESEIRKFVSAVLRNIPVYDLDSDEALGIFARSGIGDVLIARENDALQFLAEWGDKEFEIVTPTESIAVEFSTALINDHAPHHPQAVVSRAYVDFLYSTKAQKLAATHYLRPRAELEFAGDWPFQHTNLFTVDEVFGGWDQAQKTHFKPGGTWDQIQKALAFFRP